jgi:cell division septation protein DedD
MTMLSVSRKLLLGISLVFLVAGGCKERQEPAPPETPSVVRKRVVVPQPPAIQVVKPGDIEPATPVAKEATPKPEASTPKVAEVKPPAEQKAPSPKVTAEPKEVVEKPEKKAEITAVAKSKPPSAPETPPAVTFTINVASFKPRERAEQYVEELKKLGVDAYVYEVDLGEKGKWHRVAVGRFPTLKEAKDYKEELIKKGISGTFITKAAKSW